MNPLFEKLDRLGLKPLRDPNDLPPVSSTDVDELESSFGYPFPAFYKEFLLRYGISIFHGDANFDVPEDWDKKTDHGGTDIRMFHGIESGAENDLSKVIRWARADRMPAYFLPVCDSDGLPTVVYISCHEADYGHVYALSRRQIWDNLSAENAIREATHLADSFEVFLDELNIIPEDSIDPEELPPLYAAFDRRDEAFLQRIVEAGELESYRYGPNMTPLESAISDGQLWAVEFLLKHNAVTHKALSRAIQYAQPDMIRLLLAYGSNVNVRQPIYNDTDEWITPLIQVVQSHNFAMKYEMAHILIEAGANPEMPDSAGKTALDYVHPDNQKMRDILMGK